MSYNRNKKHKASDYQTENKSRKSKNRDFSPHVKHAGKRPSNVTVYLRENDDPIRVIKRFIKKCKKEKVVEKFLEKRYYVKPSEKRRMEDKKRKQTLNKIRRENEKQ
jgi:ribosomal protein S21